MKSVETLFDPGGKTLIMNVSLDNVDHFFPRESEYPMTLFLGK